ncbi:DeoR/GlpR transcriptional regulator (plasmid) [Paroceanicella profunda]|uniref:DeoR/GlpR transcriptional regulator n=1 Tax=Paroceanicella profunda TaxID=2579971 RepID=A0A5B8G036_9RHOB|nr:DeoR/GlpR family DNA-binding transcription regulator [Paroceanicella profunda]QDL94065.1 DeoR/GlpR transcriptional regulator [Paroceanicella profunda]
MLTSVRQQQILEIARESGHVVVETLAERFAVSPQTIRRDLNELCDRSLLARTHGGAMLPSGVVNVGYDTRRDFMYAEKEAIGRICAEHIPDGSSIFINIGTTTEAVARNLMRQRNLMAITNNVNVATTLSANPSCEVVVAGGVLRRSDGGIIGEATIDFIRQFRVDIGVIGASAIDADGTLLDFDYREVRVAQAIIENARRVFLVADASKFDRTAPVRICPFTNLSALFTNAPPPEAITALARENGITIEIAGEGTPPA